MDKEKPSKLRQLSCCGSRSRNISKKFSALRSHIFSQSGSYLWRNCLDLDENFHPRCIFGYCALGHYENWPQQRWLCMDCLPASAPMFIPKNTYIWTCKFPLISADWIRPGLFRPFRVKILQIIDQIFAAKRGRPLNILVWMNPLHSAPRNLA